MRTFELHDDIEQIILELVRAIPEVYLDFDVAKVQLVEDHNDGLVYSADVVVVLNEDEELVIGEVVLWSDLQLEINIYSE